MKVNRLFETVLMLIIISFSLGLGFNEAYAVEYTVYVYYIENEVEMPVLDADIRFSWMPDQAWSEWFVADEAENGLYTWDSPAEFNGDPWRIMLNNQDWDPVEPDARTYVPPASTNYAEWEVEEAP